MLIRYLWPAILWSVIILVLTLIPGKAIPEVGFFQADKFVHFFVFGTLMFLSTFGLTKYNRISNHVIRHPVLIAAMYGVVMGVVIEILQQYVPGRSFSLADILANTIGVGIGYLVFILYRKKFDLK